MLNRRLGKIDMVIHVAEAKQVLGSVGKIISDGNRVVFDLDERSYIQNKRIGIKTNVYRKWSISIRCVCTGKDVDSLGRAGATHMRNRSDERDRRDKTTAMMWAWEALRHP